MNPPVSAAEGNAAHSSAGARRQRAIFIAALALAFAWWTALVVMTLCTANPAALSRPQIEQADAVVTALVSDPVAGLVRVERVWKGEIEVAKDSTGKITIASLRETPDLKPGEPYIFPLTRSGRTFRITRTEEQSPDAAPIVYRATPDVTQQLAEIVGNR